MLFSIDICTSAENCVNSDKKMEFIRLILTVFLLLQLQHKVYDGLLHYFTCYRLVFSASPQA